MSTFRQEMELLIKFVNTDMSLDTFSRMHEGPAENQPEICTDLSESELLHENAHASVWAKIGVNSTFHRDKRGCPYTLPDENELTNYIRENNVSKNGYIKLLSDVVNAPQEVGMPLGKSDTIMSKVLSGEINSTVKLDFYLD